MRSENSATICESSPVCKRGGNGVRRKNPAIDDLAAHLLATLVAARRSVRAMKNNDTPPEFTPLRAAAERLGLPMSFLRAEALAGHLPFLRAGRRILFDVPSTHRALVDRVAHAAQGKGADP